ncbi:TonB-dependent receptor [Novosphingobium rosa]|uniref:TonB-dependent receptor n=1 Tax=Novosphingobium rosa TaxID=76978 RepID=UPI001471F74C|nr:TonB-dependent receptor [Novosphingobium rosa]
MTKFAFLLSRTALATGAAMLLAGTAQAQDAATDGGAKDDIVVTALKRATSVQETPIAITAITNKALTNANITDAYQLNRLAPGLNIRESANGGARITLRNIQAAGEPTVGIYYDETPLIAPVGVNNDAGSASPDIRLFDVDRAEVLRGPQGTLYGSASMAGTVRLIFAKPKMNKYEGAVEARLTSVDGGGIGHNEQGMVNIPLVNDVLALRAVGYYQYQNGWLDDSLRGLKNINDSQKYGGRAMLRFKPMENFTLDLTAAIQRNKGFVNNWLWGTTSGQLDHNYDAAWASLHRNSDRMDLFSANASYDLGFATLVGTASYQNRYLSYTSDSSVFFQLQQSNAARCATYLGLASGQSCTTAQLNQYRSYALSQSPSAAYSQQWTKGWTQELRLSSNGKSALNWTVGFFHSLRRAFIFSDVDSVDSNSGEIIMPLTTTPTVANGTTVAPANVLFRRYISDRLEQTSGYADVSYDITPKWSITGGTRYYKYDKNVAGQVLVGNLIIGTSAGSATANTTSDNGWIFKAGTNYKFDRNVMAYFEASQGFRPGGVNQVIGLPASFGPYQSDSLWNYELGLKTQWFDRKLTLNVDVYQIDWSNMQVSGQTAAQSTGSTFSVIANAGDARIRGVELETSVRPVDNLSFYLSTTYADAVLTTDQTSNVFAASGKKGNEIPNVPKFTLQGGGEVTRPITPGLQAIGRVDASYTGATWASFSHADAYTNRLPGYTELSLRFGIEHPDGNWGIYVFGNNMLNSLGLSSKGVGTLFGTGNVRVIGLQPRTIGLEAHKRF